MKRNKLIYLAAGVLVLSLWTGGQLREPSKVQSVAGIGIDPAGKGEYLFSLELAQTDKESAFTVKSEVLQLRAGSLDEALTLASLQNEYPVVLTHGSLVVLHPKLLGGEMENIASFLIGDWRGQSRAYLAVADGCDAAEILRADQEENLRAGNLSEQVRRVGGVMPLQQFCSRYLAGETLSLTLVATKGEGYRISGSVSVRKAGAV